MQDQEADVVINGTRLSDEEARIVRLALQSFMGTMAHELGVKDNGNPLTDRYVSNTQRVLILLNEPPTRKPS